MMPHLPPVVSLGLLPTLLLAATLAALYAVMVKKFQATRLEAVQAVFVFVVVGWVLLTATCVFFRGQGMMLRWPF
jgi:hypothetical protein